MLDNLLQWDLQALLAINGVHAPFWDHFMWLFTGKWIWIPMYASILFVLLKNFSLRYTILAVIAIALTITFADQVCATLIRPQVQRSRPSRLGPLIQENNEKSIRLMEALGQLKDKNGQYPIEKIRLHERKPGDFYRGGKYGFPSCHASNSFALAFFLLLFFKKIGLSLFILLWAALNSYSRAYIGVHFPGDLLAGMVVGLTGALLLYSLLRRVSRQSWTSPVFGTEQEKQLIFQPEKLRFSGIIIYTGLATLVFILLYSWYQL